MIFSSPVPEFVCVESGREGSAVSVDEMLVMSLVVLCRGLVNSWTILSSLGWVTIPPVTHMISA